MIMRRWVMIGFALVAAVCGPAPLRAEDDPQVGTGYLELYPAGDVYQMHVIGDGMAPGVLEGLTEAFRGDQRLQIRPKTLDLSNLMRPDFPDTLKALDDALGKDLPGIAVVMLGPQDRVNIKGPQGKRISIDSEDWRAEFGRQIGSVVQLFKKRKIATYWISLPNVRRAEPNEDVQVLNEIIREQVYLNGFKYIDAYAGFSDEGGGYSAMGPDIAGKIRLLREPNGVSFTDAGNRKLAHFVERDLRRDLTQAKADRTIPLAGNESEQAAINANQVAAAAAKPANTGPLPAVPAAAGGAAVEAGHAAGNGDQKADSGRINLSLVGPGGREEIVAVDLLRPAIPATVIALVSRKENSEKATQLGDLLIDQIPGGLMVMSSITPASDPANPDQRRRLSPTQTPYFRVMVKGERVTPRPERADDISWPRSEPPPVVEAVSAPAEAAPVALPPKKPATVKGAAKVRRPE